MSADFLRAAALADHADRAASLADFFEREGNHNAATFWRNESEHYIAQEREALNGSQA